MEVAGGPQGQQGNRCDPDLNPVDELISARASHTAEATHTNKTLVSCMEPREQPISPTESDSQAPETWRLNTIEEVLWSIGLGHDGNPVGVVPVSNPMQTSYT